MECEKDKERNNGKLIIILLIAVLMLFIIMIGILIHNKNMYKDYKTIHSEQVNSDIPGYEVPLLKITELINNRVTAGIAYDKYNYAPDEYAEMVKELEKNEDKSKIDAESYYEIIWAPSGHYGSFYEISYNIDSAVRASEEKIKNADGVTDMYTVEFTMTMTGRNKEPYMRTYVYDIAKIDSEWIFYNAKFYAGIFIGQWKSYHDIGEK